MKRAFQFGLAAGVFLGSSIFCLPARAQHMGASVARPMNVQPRAVYSRRFVPRQTIGSSSHGAGHSAQNAFGGAALAGSGLTLQQLLDPVPPPGFDYQYLSAVDGDLAMKALIDPATEWRVAEAERTLRATGGFAGSTSYLLDGGGYYYLPEESEPAGESQQAQPQQSQQPQIIVLQQAPPAQPQAQPAAEAAPAAQPLPDVGQFILVLRNGTRIQAVAFTSSKGEIIYITADGSRRTIALSDLDSGTTERVNEERGTPLQLPL